MRILIIGTKRNRDECSRSFAGSHQYSLVESLDKLVSQEEHYDAIFDFAPRKDVSFDAYPRAEALFLNVIQTTLQMFIGNETLATNTFGFNGLPTFIERSCLEISTVNGKSTKKLDEIMHSLGKEFVIINDQPGMVTPRIILMVINEAYLTVEEGTASREDVDLAMKLGTNYPFGPFEWCRRIGVRSVFEMLDTLHRSTKDERYKVSSLLQEEYQRYLSLPGIDNN